LIGCALAFFLAAASFTATSGQDVAETNPAATWTNSPLSDPKFFPIAVWLQAPDNAERYRQAGINTYVGLWKGPTEEQPVALKNAGLYVICDQNELALRHRDDPTIIAWMHGDEPDNAQSLGEGRGWGHPFHPRELWRIIASCARLIRRGLCCSISARAWRGIIGMAVAFAVIIRRIILNT
jgi:hypothetical protein